MRRGSFCFGCICCLTAKGKTDAKQPRHRFSTAPELADTFLKAVRNEPIDFFDPARILPRIQRATCAFEQGDHQLAAEILTDLEAAGHIDPALAPLRRQLNQAIRTNTIHELTNRARRLIVEKEYGLALQGVEQLLKLDISSPDALALKEQIQKQLTLQQLAESFASAKTHLDKHAYSRARIVLQNITDLRPGESRALAMLADVEVRERAYLSALHEKQQLHQAARESLEELRVRNSAHQTAPRARP